MLYTEHVFLNGLNLSLEYVYAATHNHNNVHIITLNFKKYI